MQDLLNSAALLVSSLTSSVWLLHRHKQDKPESHYKVRVFALSCFFIGAYALTRLIWSNPGSHTGTLVQMTENLSFFIALPFIATVFLATGKGWHWSMAGWGRWLLGLIAFFELTRRTDYGVIYSQVLVLLLLLALVIGALLLKTNQARLLSLGGSALAGIALLLFSPTPY
ncbi:hypothetical protein [Nitrincola sp. A-D6]|uniref:hypothetical protein n=1 Tax=Nitrincola sp. A-D6 TaxID=1545442 RepID=UPI00068C76B8|nr:hypothetical protein [Nitrincola sp. A-D6]